MYTLEELLFQLCLCDLDLDGLVHLLHVAALVVGVVFDGGGEERVDEGGLSEARFTSNLGCQKSSELSSRINRTMMVKFAPRFATILCLGYVRGLLRGCASDC